MLDSPFGAIHQFFNNPAVQTALNLPIVPVDWEECLPGAGRRRRMLSKKPLLPGQVLLAHDRPISVVPYVAELLDKANIRVLVYSGDRDMTTNAQGSELLLNSMEWSGAEGWATAYERGLWFPKHNDPHRRTFGGYIKSYANLEFLIVYNSGHLVPFNRDEIALDLVTRFLGRRPFLDKSLPKFHVESLNHKSPSRHDTLRESSDNAALPVVPTAKPSLNRHVWTFLLGLVSFLLGIFVSQFLSLQRRGDYQTIPNHEK